MSLEVAELRRQLKDKDDKIRDLEMHNKRLNEEIHERDKELDDKRREIRELKLSGGQPRRYLDPEDEKEANAWREKANNLLTLLDNLQSDMQKDLKDLESETFSPGSSRLSAGRGAYESPSYRYTEREPRRSPDPAPVPRSEPRNEPRNDESAARRSERSDKAGGRGERHRHSRAREEPHEHEDDAEEADDGGAPRTASNAGATGSDGAPLQAAYRQLNAAAKKIHTIYKSIKDGPKNSDQGELWKKSQQEIKEAAKAARKAAQEAAKSTFGSDFADAARDLAAKEVDWVTAAKGLKLRAVKSDAEAMDQAAKKYSDTIGAIVDNPSSSSAVDAHAKATQALAATMDKLMTTIAGVFGGDAGSKK